MADQPQLHSSIIAMVSLAAGIPPNILIWGSASSTVCARPVCPGIKSMPSSRLLATSATRRRKNLMPPLISVQRLPLSRRYRRERRRTSRWARSTTPTARPRQTDLQLWSYGCSPSSTPGEKHLPDLSTMHRNPLHVNPLRMAQRSLIQGFRI